LNEFSVLAESGTVLKIGDDVVPAHPAGRSNEAIRSSSLR
jgi:hypothetical protein